MVQPATRRRRPSRLARAWLIAATTTVALAGCTGPVPEPTGTAAPDQVILPTLVPRPTLTPTADEVLRHFIAGLTPEQKATQLIMVALMNNDDPTGLDALIQANLGGVLLLGTWTDQAQVRQAVDHLTAQRPAGGIGLTVAVDQEGGWVQRLRGPGFSDIPTALVQGGWAPADLTAQATIWGNELKAVGVTVNLAPVADTVPADLVDQNEPVGQLDREFGTTPDVTGEHAAAVIAGLTAAGIQSCVKHFPGLGRVAGNTDNTVGGIVDTITTATDPYLDAFAEAFAAEPAMVMVSLATYAAIDPTTPAVFSRTIVTDLLRGQLGWHGVVISDSLGAAAVAQVPPDQRAVWFVQAGGDIAVVTSVDQANAAIAGLLAAMDQSPDFTAQVDASLLRILKAKQQAGLI